MLYEWQKDALTYFKKHNNCIIQAATGTGKTYYTLSVLKHVMQKNPEMRILIIVPKNVILEYTWYKELTKDIPLHYIGLFYGDVKEHSRITITNTYNLEKVGYDDYDCIIADEVHNMMSERLLGFLKRPKPYKVGLTATLKRGDMTHWDVLECFSFNLFNYTLEQGVNDDILNNFNFYNIGVRMSPEDQDDYDEIAGKLRLYSLMKKEGKWSGELQKARYKLLDRRKKLLGMNEDKIAVIDRLKEDLLGRKIIVFNEYNAAAPLTFWLMTELGFKPCIFNTDIPKKVKTENLNNYRKDRFDTIITTRALDEGYNLPAINAMVILCGGSASRQMIQRVGRGLRKGDRNTDIYQVYFIDTIEEEQALKRYELIKDSCDHYENKVI